MTTTENVEENNTANVNNSNKRVFSSTNHQQSLLPVSILFKRRNHNTLSRLQTQEIVFNSIPRSKCRVDFKNPKVFAQ